MVEIVNVVATGAFEQELNLSSLATDLSVPNIEFDPEISPGLQIRFENNGPVVIVYTSGSYNMMGAKSEEQIKELYVSLYLALADLGIEIDSDRSNPKITNFVCKENLEMELDLNALATDLGVEEVEYEPEQSAFVYYYPENFDCVITIPANGVAILTGVTKVEEAERAFDHLRRVLNVKE